MLLVRTPDLLICWRGSQLILKDLESGKSLHSSPELVAILALFDSPRDPAKVIAGYNPEIRKPMRRALERLAAFKILIPASVARRRVSRIRVWKENLASAHYHVAARDIRFLEKPAEMDRFQRALAGRRRYPKFKRYGSAARTPLPSEPPNVPEDERTLQRILKARRTVRQFRPQPIAFGDLAEIVRGTWGQTGWFEGGDLGRFVAKTSPSAGSLHPIECYVLAWAVRGLASGLYHYDVLADELRQLRSGDFRKEAVRAASGQPWVRDAAFLCVMTAVFGRTLWKYNQENAYRVIWMDAGHLGQTFCLLATSLGLGPFTTAAIQDSYIEKLIGLDGVTEFPVYLCGAGVPKVPLMATSRTALRGSPKGSARRISRRTGF
jgi:SagB-type dehydrogenase family enzyme